MRNKFSFGELSGIIDASKKPEIVKIASVVGEENAPVANAAEVVCRVADTLDELGHADLADQLVASTQVLLTQSLVKSAEEEKEDDEDKDTGKDDAEGEVMSITCPHCSKSFDVVVEEEDGGCEVETVKEDKKEKEAEKPEDKKE